MSFIDSNIMHWTYCLKKYFIYELYSIQTWAKMFIAGQMERHTDGRVDSQIEGQSDEQ